MKRTLCAGLLASLIGLDARPASADATTALDRLQPAPAGDAFVAVPAATVGDGVRPAAALLVSWARSPLAYRLHTPAGDRKRDVVSDLVIGHALVSLDLVRRLMVEADLPVALVQRGEATQGALTLPAPGGAAVGDLRLGARVVVLRPSGWRPAVALSGSVWLPTGAGGAYNGAPTVRAAPGLIVGTDTGRLVWSLGVSRRFQPERVGSFQSSEVVGSAAIAVRLGDVQIGPEFWLQHAVAAGLVGRASRDGAEALLTARYRLGSLVASLAGGPGFGSLPGTPTYRLLAGLAFAPAAGPEAPPPTVDPPSMTAGPGGAATAGPGATPPGSSRPTEPGVPAGTSLPSGGSLSPGASLPSGAPPPPPDGDSDGIPDGEDACPAVAGARSDDPARHGCPPDRDTDGVPDAQDACPAEKGPASTDPKQNGCPRSVRVEGEQIVILQQVVFPKGKDVIDPASFGLLQEVTEVLAQHPEIARVAIDGHTDNDGLERANLELSRRRAAAVLRWMTEHGVDARRLEARGFGPRRPLADNRTEDGRRKNRRVEFQILRRTTLGEAGWGEAP